MIEGRNQSSLLNLVLCYFLSLKKDFTDDIQTFRPMNRPPHFVVKDV